MSYNRFDESERTLDYTGMYVEDNLEELEVGDSIFYNIDVQIGGEEGGYFIDQITYTTSDDNPETVTFKPYSAKHQMTDEQKAIKNALYKYYDSKYTLETLFSELM